MPEDEKKVYPGSLARYQEIREMREALAASSEDQTLTEQLVSVGILEELAGLAYILDGIRYSARRR